MSALVPDTAESLDRIARALEEGNRLAKEMVEITRPLHVAATANLSAADRKLLSEARTTRIAFTGEDGSLVH